MRNRFTWLSRGGHVFLLDPYSLTQRNNRNVHFATSATQTTRICNHITYLNVPESLFILEPFVEKTTCVNTSVMFIMSKI